MNSPHLLISTSKTSIELSIDTIYQFAMTILQFAMNRSKELVVEVIRKCDRVGESLWRTYRDDPALYSARKRLFKTWIQARAAAGLPKPTREIDSPDKVRLKIIELYEQEMPLAFSSHLDEKLLHAAACEEY